MKEEEVDQYFKNKFNQFTPVPSADAWARLQSKMEPPQKKKSGMWVYYAAAVLTLTIMSGALFFYFNTNSLNPDNSLTQLKPIAVPLQIESQPEFGIADAGTKIPPALPTVEPAAAEKNVKSNNSNTNATSKPVKKGKKIRPGILVATAKSIPYNSQDNYSSPEQKPKDAVTVASVNPAASGNTPAMEGSVMEVIIKKDPEVVAAAPDKEYYTVEEAIKENVSKKGRLVKNIFKQARNLKNGEKVELSTLGLNANYRIDVESKLFKQKYTKVINL